MRRVLEFSAPMILGLFGGSAAVHLLADDAPSEPVAESSSQTTRTESRGIDPDLLRRLARLEREVSAERQRPTDSVPEASEPEPEASEPQWDSPEVPPITREEAREQAELEFDEYVLQHEEGPVDPQWAAEASSSFTQDINTLGEEHGFALVDIDCRSSSCLAEVEWPSQALADSSWTELLHGKYEMNCGRGVFLDEADDPESATRARVLFECDA